MASKSPPLDILPPRRTILLGLAGLASACSLPPKQMSASTPPKILFICQAGTVKSPVARELFKRRAKERGLVANVAARGITPEEHMSAKLLAAALADGIDPKIEPVRQLAIEDMRAADIVIYFDRPPFASEFPGALDWTDLPSMNDDYPSTRAIILERSEPVIDGLLIAPTAHRHQPTKMTPSI